jgi:hypothetical protein
LPKQILVYMSREDEDAFLEFLRSMGNMTILPNSSPTSTFAQLDVLPEASQTESTRKFWLQNTAINLPVVVVLSEPGGSFVIDGFQSPVVEFLRSFTVAGMMLPGRLQADMTYFDGDEQDLVAKPVEFRKWFGSMEAWIRKKYKHLTLLTYVGPGAQRFREQGGLLY